MQVVAVIPSRYASKRFPAKALALVDGVPLVRHVAQRVLGCGVAHRVIVATDDARIAAAVDGLDLDVALSSERFACGTDRVCAAAHQRGLEQADTLLNVQGDEALIDEATLRAAVAALARGEMGTVATELAADSAEAADPNVVQVEVDVGGLATTFRRGGGADAGAGDTARCYKHVGVYAFSADTLARFGRLSPTAAERRERLEQLRALQHGWRIGVELVPKAGFSLNTPADLERLNRQIHQGEIGCGAHPEGSHPSPGAAPPL